MNINERIRKQLSESKFCYGKDGGQGLINKKECTCTDESPCQAKLDAEQFTKAFERVEYNDHNKRNEVLEEIRPDFKNSKWFRDNVSN